MWLPVLASVLALGAALCVVYFVYLKIHHPDVIFSARKKFPDFLQDSFASLIQSEQPPMFLVKPTLSAGLQALCRVFRGFRFKLDKSSKMLLLIIIDY